MASLMLRRRNENNPCARSKWDETHAVSTIKCSRDKLSTRVMELKGLDSFDGKKWGGLTVDNVFKNALNSWKANGNKVGRSRVLTGHPQSR